MEQQGPWVGLREYMSTRKACVLSIAEIGDNSLRTLVEQYSEDRCAFLPVPDDRVICRVLGKYLIWVDAHDQGLSPHLIFQGYWEMWVTAVVARFTRPGMTAIDVGANVGYYTILLADAVGPLGRVIAWEPNPRLAQMLSISAGINGFAPRVSVRPEALSASRQHPLEFAIPQLEPKNAGLIRTEMDRASFAAQFGTNMRILEVPVAGLDDFELENVGIIKIDAEGAEYDIWTGMQKTIARSPDLSILMEVNAMRGYDISALYREASQLFPVRHVDFDGEIKPLTLEMLESQRPGSDWMMFLRRG